MSGVCGWLAAPHRAVGEAESRSRLAGMAAPLVRLDHAPLACRVNGASALAIAAPAAACHWHAEDGLLVALWGHPAIGDGPIATPAELPAARVASLWRAQGAQLCAALGGPFALCLIDQHSDQALLAIDRSGIHSLIYQASPHGLVFSSRADSLRAHPLLDGDVDPQSLYNYLYFHVIPGPATIHQGQQRLLPGQYLHYRAGQVTRATYWCMAFEENAVLPFKQLQREFLRTLHGAMHGCIAGEQVGAFLRACSRSSE